MGGGDASKWAFEKVRMIQPDLPILGMIGEKDWLEGQEGVVDFVRPADLRDIARKFSRHDISEVAVFGKALSSIRWRDIPRATGILIKAATSGYPYQALPNAYYETVKKLLDDRQIKLLNLGELVPDLRKRPGTTIGVGNIPEHLELYEKAVSLMRDKVEIAQKQGIVVFQDRDPFLEVSGTKTALRTCIRNHWSLTDAVLVKAEVPAHQNLDVPVIDQKLIELCGKQNMRGVVADAASLVIDEANVVRSLERYDMCVHFV